jgi:DNA mismatch endonuclease, patch repair protein
MADAHSPEQRSYNMSRIRSSGTAPERRLGELLKQIFPNTEIIERPNDLPGKPDWFIPSIRIAFFADGCFFHKCPKHFIMPINNKDYWKPKIERNKLRDKKVNKLLIDLEITPVRIWEHNLRKDLRNAKRKIKRTLQKLENT